MLACGETSCAVNLPCHVVSSSPYDKVPQRFCRIPTSKHSASTVHVHRKAAYPASTALWPELAAPQRASICCPATCRCGPRRPQRLRRPRRRRRHRLGCSKRPQAPSSGPRLRKRGVTSVPCAGNVHVRARHLKMRREASQRTRCGHAEQVRTISCTLVHCTVAGACSQVRRGCCMNTQSALAWFGARFASLLPPAGRLQAART